MEGTLIDATNVIGLIGDIASYGRSGTNVPKHVIGIMDDTVAPAMDSNLVKHIFSFENIPRRPLRCGCCFNQVAESGAKLLTIAVGTVEIDSSEILSDILPLKSYDELPTVSRLVIDTICQGMCINYTFTYVAWLSDSINF